jgi:ribosome-associated toxin RatA of RatAB toxin-antitoxin module
MKLIFLYLNILPLWVFSGLAFCSEIRAQSAFDLLPDEASLSRLRAGETEVWNVIADGGAAAGVMIFMHTSAENIWDIIVSCKKAAVFLDGLRHCEVLEENGEYAVTRQVVDKGWYTPRLDYTFETDRMPFQHMDFRLLEGNMRILNGTWDFISLDGGILVKHQLQLKPGFPAPRWLIRRTLKKNFPDMMLCIRALSGGSGSENTNKSDWQACPGENE